MFTKIYWLYTYEKGNRLGIMARPRGNEWLEQEIKQFRLSGVDVVVSLLEKEEVYELGLKEEGQCCSDYELTFIHFPIKDRSVPTSVAGTNKIVLAVHDALIEGKSVVIHCRMGIGRSSIIAGAVLLKSGGKASDILKQISQVRGVSVPDTEEQAIWLKNRE